MDILIYVLIGLLVVIVAGVWLIYNGLVSARQRVRVLLTTVFRPTGGTPRTVRRTVIVPRTPYASGPPVTG